MHCCPSLRDPEHLEPFRLGRFPNSSQGRGLYPNDDTADFERASIFYRAAAARPSTGHLRNAASAADAASSPHVSGEWWDVDISPLYPRDPESNCRTFFFFERDHAFPFLAF